MLKQSKYHAFSLIEVLIALSIFSILLLCSTSMIFDVEHMLKKEHEYTLQQLHALQVLRFFKFYLRSNVKPCASHKASQYLKTKPNSVIIIRHENIAGFKLWDDRKIIITQPIVEKKDTLWLGNCTQHALMTVIAIRKQRNRQRYVVTLATKISLRKINHVMKRSVLHFYLRQTRSKKNKALYLRIDGKRANELVPGVARFAVSSEGRYLYLRFSTLFNKQEKEWQDIQLLYHQVLS